MFGKKTVEKAVFKGAKANDVNFFTQTTNRNGTNMSFSLSYVNAVFEREDETLLTLSTSTKKASKLMKDREGILTYRGGKLISFEPV